MCVDGRAVHRDANASVSSTATGKLCLRASEGHRDAFLADEEWLIRQFLYDPLKVFRLAHRPPLNLKRFSHVDQSRVRPQCHRRSRIADRLHRSAPSEKLSESSQLLAFWQEVCLPRAGKCRRQCAPILAASFRDRKGASQSNPGGVISEAGSTLIDVNRCRRAAAQSIRADWPSGSFPLFAKIGQFGAVAE